MKLHKDEASFQTLVTLTSQHFGIREVFIEKDYWVTHVLKNLSLSEHVDAIVFKGGTSLSKVHKIINRFSEDIDLAYVSTVGGIKPHYSKHFSKIDKSITNCLLGEIVTAGITNKGPPMFRKTLHSYKRIVNSTDFGDATDKLILEINAFTMPVPYGRKAITSYIHDYLSITGQQEAIDEFELGTFEVNVLEIEKTFTEKICGMAKFSNKENDNLDFFRSKIRHLYDVSKLLENESIQTFLASENFLKMLKDVRDDDRKISENAPWANKKFKDALIYNDSSETIKKIYNAFSQGQFPSLLYSRETLPTQEKLVGQIQQVAARLAEYDAKFEN